MDEITNSLYSEILELKSIIKKLESRIFELESNSSRSSLDKIQLLRVKNNEELSDSYITSSLGYHELSPEKAYRLYNEQDKDFIVLDVSAENFSPFKEIPESVKIPLEDLKKRITELKNKHQSIFVISEKGVRSILACHILNQYGFFNLNHISGGHKFWPGYRLSYDDDNLYDLLAD